MARNNAPMGRPSSTQLFRDNMEEAKGIAKALELHEMTGLLPTKRDEYTIKLTNYALEEAKENGEKAGLRAANVKKGQDLIGRDDGQYGISYVIDKAKKRMDKASEQATIYFTGGLEEILDEAPADKVKNLVRGKLNDDTKVDDLLAAGAGKAFAKWRELYQKTEVIRQLYETAKSGQIDDDQRRALIAPAARLAAKEERKNLKNKGYSIVEQERGARDAIRAVFEGHRGRDFAEKGAEELLRESEETLEKYEKDNRGKSLKNYVIAGLSGISKGKLGWDKSLIARDLAYSALG